MFFRINIVKNLLIAIIHIAMFFLIFKYSPVKVLNDNSYFYKTVEKNFFYLKKTMIGISLLKKHSIAISKYDKILEENTKLRKMLWKSRLSEQENKKLKKIIRYKNNINMLIGSYKIINKGSNLKDHYIINGGYKDGISIGQAVIQNNCLIGKVIKVHKKSSIVHLLSDYNFKIRVIINNNNYGLAVGRYKSNVMDLFFLSNQFSLTDGQAVVTSKENNKIPYGLYVGQVVFHKRTPYVTTNYDLKNHVIDVIR